MLRKLNKACVCGHFGFGENLLNGQTVKTKIIMEELKRRLGKDKVMELDTHGGKKKLFSLPFSLFNALKKCENIIILPAQNGIRVIAPLLVLENKIFKRKLQYVVIGGWLPEFLKNRFTLAKQLKKFDNIYVETNAMKKALISQGFANVEVMPNCKQIKILNEDELIYANAEPYRLCTFSRVMKEKGIEDAINAVREINDKYGRNVFSLDIYGQVDAGQTIWFDELTASFPDYVKYGGVVPFDKSTDVLKEYYALLFPTYYDGEGFAGTLIDAMAAGVPIVASDWKYNGEIVKNNETGILYPVNNKDELVDKLIYCYENPKMWADMKCKCVKEAKEYTPETVIDILINRL